MTETQRHIPVMLSEVLTYLHVQDGATYVDATFGNGGYTSAILEKADCNVIAIDRDPSVSARVQELKEKYKDRFTFKKGVFSDLKNLVSEQVDGVVFDIGVSSMQIDDAERGFSFSKNAKLDMRMSMCGLSAYDVVNTMPETELADLLYKYGEEKKSRQIAKKIAEYRKVQPIETTLELADIVHSVIYTKQGVSDSAMRTFQALRIYVNDELNELQKGLSAAGEILKPQGRLVVVDFHSLEDRIVKNFFKENALKKVHLSRYKKDAKTSVPYKVFSEISDVLTPSKSEIYSNPRAHSAKLRYATKNKGAFDD